MSLEFVREHDRDRFLATLYAPADKQQQLLSLYSFAAEIARIPRLVSEPQIGEIRLQWWAETLDALERGEKVDHPVALEIGRLGLPYAPLKAMVDARRFDLYADKMPSLAYLEGYLGETESSVFQLASMILAPDRASGAAELCGVAGVAYGLAKVLQRKNPAFTPMGETVASLAEHAYMRLREARLLPLPRVLLPALLPVSLAETYLSGPAGLLTPLKMQYLVWRAARRETI